MEMPDVIYVEYSADEWVNGKYIPLYEGGTQCDGNKTEYHHSRIVEALRKENEELKAKLDKAKDSLRFYALRQRYEGTNHIVFNGFEKQQVAEDGGQRARKTLEEI